MDVADPETFFVIPKALYLFGSTLTDKPNPADLDLILEYKDRPAWQPEREKKNKQLQEKMLHIRQSQGKLAAEEWLHENVIKPMYGE